MNQLQEAVPVTIVEPTEKIKEAFIHVFRGYLVPFDTLTSETRFAIEDETGHFPREVFSVSDLQYDLGTSIHDLRVVSSRQPPREFRFSPNNLSSIVSPAVVLDQDRLQ